MTPDTDLQQAIERIEDWSKSSSSAVYLAVKTSIATLLTAARELQQVKEERDKALKWKEEDPRMIREQMRVHDAAYQHLFDKNKATESELTQRNADAKLFWRVAKNGIVCCDSVDCKDDVHADNCTITLYRQALANPVAQLFSQEQRKETEG